MGVINWGRVVVFIAPFLLFSIPSNFFDDGKSNCISILMFNEKCYGCGMTRAIQHMLHGEFSIGYEFNKISILVFPLLFSLWLFDTYKLYVFLRNCHQKKSI